MQQTVVQAIDQLPNGLGLIARGLKAAVQYEFFSLGRLLGKAFIEYHFLRHKPGPFPVA
jgi:hypothetical protein